MFPEINLENAVFDVACAMHDFDRNCYQFDADLLLMVFPDHSTKVIMSPSSDNRRLAENEYYLGSMQKSPYYDAVDAVWEELSEPDLTDYCEIAGITPYEMKERVMEYYSIPYKNVYITDIMRYIREHDKTAFSYWECYSEYLWENMDYEDRARQFIDEMIRNYERNEELIKFFKEELHD